MTLRSIEYKSTVHSCAVYLIVCLIWQPQSKQFHVSAQIHVHTNWPIERKGNKRAHS